MLPNLHEADTISVIRVFEVFKLEDILCFISKSPNFCLHAWFDEPRHILIPIDSITTPPHVRGYSKLPRTMPIQFTHMLHH